MSRITRVVALALGAATVMTSSAYAGGFDRGGVNIDLLYSDERIDTEVTATYVMPQRTIENVQRGANEAINAGVSQALAPATFAAGITGPGELPSAAQIAQFVALNPAVNGPVVAGAQAAVVAGYTGAGGNPAPASTAAIGVDNDFFVPRVGLKVGFTDDVACLGTYSEPYGADASYGLNNAYSPSTVDFSVDTRDLGLTCSYRFMGPQFSRGQSYFRVIGGVSYQELDGFQSRQRFLDFAPLGGVGGVTNPLGVGTFDVSGDSVGWRIGAAFEIPDILLRAQLIYSSRYKYDLTGFQDNSDFFGQPAGTTVIPITANTEIPQSLELKLQSGIAENTLAFLNIKWQEWSRLQSIAINGGMSPVTGGPTILSFDPFYRDGWTVTAGLGRRINEMLAARASVTWDRGTATITGSQTDTWTLAAGVAYTPNENIELRFGGAIGLLTSGVSQAPPSNDAASNVTYTFGTDIITAISGGLKITF